MEFKNQKKKKTLDKSPHRIEFKDKSLGEKSFYIKDKDKSSWRKILE